MFKLIDDKYGGLYRSQEGETLGGGYTTGSRRESRRGGKGKATGHPPQGAISLLVRMGGWIGPFLLEMYCGLSRISPLWNRSLDQVISSEMDEAP